jgi:uncharacterized membrane protein
MITRRQATLRATLGRVLDSIFSIKLVLIFKTSIILVNGTVSSVPGVFGSMGTGE